MYKFLIVLVLLLIVPFASLADGPDAVSGSYDNCVNRSADLCWQVERPADIGVADNALTCLHPATSGGGFPFCATKSILRWREAPAHNVRQPLLAARWM